MAWRWDLHESVLEVAPERGRLVGLHLPVLDGAAPQGLVHLGDVDGRRSLLVLGGGVTDPVVDVGGVRGVMTNLDQQ